MWYQLCTVIFWNYSFKVFGFSFLFICQFNSIQFNPIEIQSRSKTYAFLLCIFRFHILSKAYLSGDFSKYSFYKFKTFKDVLISQVNICFVYISFVHQIMCLIQLPKQTKNKIIIDTTEQSDFFLIVFEMSWRVFFSKNVQNIFQNHFILLGIYNTFSYAADYLCTNKRIKSKLHIQNMFCAAHTWNMIPWK